MPPPTTTTTTTVPPTEVQPTATVGDYVWRDTDKDGTPDAGEAGIKDAKVRLTNTDNDGLYLFSALAQGNYKVERLMSSVSGDFTTVGSSSFLLPDGASFLTADFGLTEILPVTGLDADRFGWAAVTALAVAWMLVLGSGRRRQET